MRSADQPGAFHGHEAALEYRTTSHPGGPERVQDRLRWLLHAIDPELRVPAGALDRKVWLDRVARRLARAAQTVEVRIARDLVRRCRQLTGEANALEREIAVLVAG